MDITVYPGILSGTVKIIPSKSQAHRLLICAAFADQETEIICPDTNEDISATVDCLNALGARIHRSDAGYQVVPIREIPESAVLDCRESGSTLRFLLPIAGALGIEATFLMSGRLPYRPLSPLQEELNRMGYHISKHDANTLLCNGKLHSGTYRITGTVSSQFISGLLFALILLNSASDLEITGQIESYPYIEMTKQALMQFGANISGNRIIPSFPLKTHGRIIVEGDWSNAAFFIAANTLGNKISITGLNEKSLQGDKIIKEILSTNTEIDISVANIPDLVPILSIAAAAGKGGRFTNIARLRLKESDRVASTIEMLHALGVKADADNNTLTVFPGKFQSCTIDSHNDHRIAMSAAIASTIAEGPVTILGAESVCKSYPTFWETFRSIGGKYEQHLR